MSVNTNRKKVLAGLILLLTYFAICCSSHSSSGKNVSPKEKQERKRIFNSTSCQNVEGFTDELIQEIRSHSNDVKKIIDLVLRGSEKHSTYNELALFCDTYGARMSGSKALANAIEYMENKMRQSNLDNVHGEKVMIPKWEFGEQWAEMVEPIKHRMTIATLGTSVGTKGKALEAEVQLVHSFDELKKLGEAGKIDGKIVVYNYKWTSYGECVQYRERGASEAVKYGAVAALVRSVTNFSIYSPHAGMASQSIPTAAITVEDADLIDRIVNRDKKVVLKLFIEAQNYDDVESKNLIAEIKGSSKPEEVVLISGHIDDWPIGSGSLDDGGGLFITYKAIHVLRKLNLRAKRSLRAVLWVAEEFGLIGAQQYFKDHQHELKNFKVVMESDLGTFRPLGLSIINSSPLGQCIVNEVLKLTEEIGTTRLDFKYEGSDIEVFTDKGVPGLSLANENSKYFYFHHTAGDSITVEDPDDLDKSTILWAAASYVLANLSQTIG